MGAVLLDMELLLNGKSHKVLLAKIEEFEKLEFQGPTGHFILAPAEGSVWRMQGLASLTSHIC